MSFTSTFTTWTAARIFDVDAFLFQVQPRHFFSALLHCEAAAVVTNATGSSLLPPSLIHDTATPDTKRHSQDRPPLHRHHKSVSHVFKSHSLFCEALSSRFFQSAARTAQQHRTCEGANVDAETETNRSRD